MTAEENRLEAYFRTVADVDADEATRLVLEMLDDGTSVDRITNEVLGPSQVRVGQLWERGLWSVADEHAATAVTETALSALASATSRPHSPQSRHIVVASAEGEWHTLPARMVAAVGATGDARVTVLGPSMPADQLGRRLAVGDVDLLALSCSLAPNLIGAARCVAAAHAAGVPVLAGGSAFGSTPHRALAIGADAWAAHPAALLEEMPEMAHRATVVPPEAVVLDEVDDATVAEAHDRLIDANPGLRALDPRRQLRVREDLRWIVRYTGAAVLTDDPTVIDDYLGWLGSGPEGRLPADAVPAAARILADTVEGLAPVGSQLLRDAADRAQRPGKA